MAVSTCHSFHRLTCTPQLMLLTLTLLAIKFTDPTTSEHAFKHEQKPPSHDLYDFYTNQLSLSSSKFNVTSLSLTCKRPFVSMYSLPKKNTVNKSICMIMLVTCGDIEENPGPIKFPCMACRQPPSKHALTKLLLFHNDTSV